MKTRILAVFALAMTLVFGLLAPSNAEGNTAYAEMSFSNFRPSAGEPIVIYLDLLDCGTFPTNLSINLATGFDSDPFAVLSKTTSGYKMKKVGSVYKIQWLYRGPAGDGITNSPVVITIDGSGGCITDPDDFRSDFDVNYWIPSSFNWFGLFIYNFKVFSDVGGLTLDWQTFDARSDSSSFFEIQYAIRGTEDWSRSFTTRDWSYKLRGLTKGTIYDVRIRARSNTTTGEWTVDLNSPIVRSPAAWTITSKTVTGSPTRLFASGDTVKINMKFEECTVEPQRFPDLAGTISYTLFASDGRTQEQFNPRVGLVGVTGFTYNSALQKLEGDFDIESLPNGTYEMEAYLIGNCGWTFGPGSLDGSPYPFGNKLEFQVGSRAAQVPLWGEIGPQYYPGAEVSAQTSTSAKIEWAQPRNLEDGPFVFTVDIVRPNGTLVKTLGSTRGYSFTATGLKPATDYRFRVSASNAVTTTPAMRSTSTTFMRTANVTVKRGTKLTAVAYARAVGASVPSGAKVTIAKPAGTFPFTDCKFAKNVVTFSNSVGACTVQLTIKPKKVGKTQPKSIVSQHDVILRR